MKKMMSKRNLWLFAIILSYLYVLVSKKMINTYKENEILVLNYSASMICDFAILVMYIIRQVEMKKRFNIFKNSFQSFKDAYSKESAFEKNLKNDEKVEKFGKDIRTAGNQLIELGENWLEEDEMAEFMLEDVKSIVRETKNMIAKL